jgi:hypothetical protein
MIQTALPEEIVFALAGGAKSLRSDVSRDVERRKTDAATGVMNQNRLICFQSAHRNNQGPGGEVIHRQGGAGLKAQLPGLLKHLRVGHDNQLGLPAESGHRNYRLADNRLIDSGTHGFDLARHLITHDARFRRSVRVQTLSRQNVGKVQPCSLNSDQNLAVRRYGIGPRFDLHHRGVAISGRYHCAHSLNVR